MTLEELKAEAEKLGYSVVKKPVSPGKLLACTCGSKQHSRIGSGSHCGRYSRAYYVKCRKCKKEGPHVSVYDGNGYLCMRKDEAIRLAGEKWNEMIREEMKKGEKNG